MTGSEVLYGFHPVMEAITAKRRRIFKIYLAQEGDPRRKTSVQRSAQTAGIPVKGIPKLELNRMAGTPLTQGVAAEVSAYPVADLSDILNQPKIRGENPFLLLIDNLVDPQNLGALIRTGACAGIHGVIIPKDRSSPPTPAVTKASAGALEHIRLARVSNLSGTIEILKQSGIWVVGMDPSARNSLFYTDLTASLAFVVGGEEKGIRPLVKRHCDDLVSIPIRGEIGSLNASVAGGIAMYEAVRQRQGNESLFGNAR
ncbi:MAG: 23S rRNA (guanosine(2251)-2'-O)-methyltransferase RlmB [Thermodesulfobacteriota bacterium]